MAENASTILTSNDDLKKARKLIWISSILAVGISVLVEAYYYLAPSEPNALVLRIMLGITLPMGCFYIAQKIIDTTSFLSVLIVGTLLILLDICRAELMSMKNPEISPFKLYPSASLLLFVIYFRLLMLVFYPGYAQSQQKPIIIFRGRGARFWKGKSEGYVPTLKESTLSLLLQFGSFLIPMTIIWLLKRAIIFP